MDNIINHEAHLSRPIGLTSGVEQHNAKPPCPRTQILGCYDLTYPSTTRKSIVTLHVSSSNIV